jgi:hypothetical protein
MEKRKIKLYVIVECDWEEYDEVNPELILEDAVFDAKEGVRIYLDPERATENFKAQSRAD